MRQTWVKLEPQEREYRRRVFVTRALPITAGVALLCMAGGLLGAAVAGRGGFLDGGIVAAVALMAVLLLLLVTIAIAQGVRGTRVNSSRTK